MRRREVITLLGTAAMWPLAARAEQSERARRIGVLMNVGADDAEGQARIAAFLQGLQQLGWTDGGNVRIDYRWAAGDAGSFQRYAEELLASLPLCCNCSQPLLANADAASRRICWSTHRNMLAARSPRF